jgi:hypothetical protein
MWDVALWLWVSSSDIMKDCCAFSFRVKLSKKNGSTGKIVCYIGMVVEGSGCVEQVASQ